ncbi:MAG: hypothetical protein O4803_04635 [Trichodesmium sp. St15_bin1_1]|nr:hypothetical protein [Trichodesmium sp. St15_bin1_1]
MANIIISDLPSVNGDFSWDLDSDLNDLTLEEIKGVKGGNPWAAALAIVAIIAIVFK